MELLNCFKKCMIDNVDKSFNVLQKKVFYNRNILAATSDDVILFKRILAKDELSSDDVNDLLICYSDHIMDDYELLDFVLHNDSIYYELDEIFINFDIRNIIIKYLLQSNDNKIIVCLLKLFSNKLVCFDNIQLNEKMINLGVTLEDVYLLILEIMSIEDIELRNKKITLLMMFIDIEKLSWFFLMSEINFEIIEKQIDRIDESGEDIDVNYIRNVFANQLIVEGRTFGNIDLIKKVLSVYQNYSSLNMTFKIGDFIRYYNNTYGDDFSSFYFNRKNALLDVELLYYILTFNRDDYDNKFRIYADYLGRFKALDKLNNEWQEEISLFINSKLSSDKNMNVVLIKYFDHIENLRKPVDVTLKYYIYLNISKELREAFFNVVMWYLKNDEAFFTWNILVDSKKQKDTTFSLLVDDMKKEIFINFNRRKEIHNKYFELVKKTIGIRYISINRWKEYLHSITREYYSDVGPRHLKKMSELVEDNINLVDYQSKNFTLSEFYEMCDIIKEMYPEMNDEVNLISRVLSEQLKENIVTNRKYYEELALQNSYKIIKTFVESSFICKESFVKSYGISIDRFNRAVLAIMQKDSELYYRYLQKIGLTGYVGYKKMK